MKLSRLHQVGGRATDLDADIRFYRDILGATFIAKYDPPGLVFFSFGDTRLLLEKGADPATLYLSVDDIDAAHAELVDKGVVFDQSPHLVFHDTEGTFGDKNVEEWMAFFKDLSGNSIALAARKSPA